MEFLDNRPSDRACVFALDDNSTACPVDDLLHEDISSFVGGFACLMDVFVPEIPKNILHQVFKFESGEIV
ncbi:hypothetical protein C438_02597 [Haloferax denitrificans ATCC 35960]|uniref:Uncharacterized protein n=1 Tax=Haloferax denitrificans ATCC 35960 TaxID=662478 RepID=M0JJ25_9EURY|nr:hypothetical protein C438_02597 [Haloferax denitrificans ATCC 35960]